MKTIVNIPTPIDSRKKSWAKTLTGIDVTKTNGYAFAGDWVRRGERAELPVGSLVMLYDEPGSVKNWYPLVRVMRVEEDGTLHEVLSYEGEVGERSWALAVRDKTAAILAEAQGQEPEEGNPLASFSDEELIAELKRRGAL
jgi:hypothetical protein